MENEFELNQCPICGERDCNLACQITEDDLNACYQRPPIKHFVKEPGETAVQISGDPDPEGLKKFDEKHHTPDIPPVSVHAAYCRVLDEAEKIWIDRQSQYGMTPFPTKPEVLLSLCQVKLWRLEQDFGAEDGWLDLLNYAAIGLMVARNQWKEDE